MRVIGAVFLLLFATHSTYSHSIINVRCNLGSKWQNVLYLKKIDKINQLLSGGGDNIIDSAQVREHIAQFTLHDTLFKDGCMVLRLNFLLTGTSNPGSYSEVYDTYNYIFIPTCKNDTIELYVDSLIQNFKIVSASNRSIYDLQNYIHQHIRKRLLVGNDIGLRLKSQSVDNSSITPALLQSYQEMYLTCYEQTSDSIIAGLSTLQDNLLKIIGMAYTGYPTIKDRCLPLIIQVQDNLTKLIRLTPLEKDFVKALSEDSSVMSKKISGFCAHNIHNNLVCLDSIKPSKIYVIDFWASWCKPCREEARTTLLRLHKLYSVQELQVISISFDRDTQKWQRAVTDDKYTWLNLRSSIEQVQKQMGLNISSIPFSIVLDERKQIINYGLRGPLLERFIKSKI